MKLCQITGYCPFHYGVPPVSLLGLLLFLMSTMPFGHILSMFWYTFPYHCNKDNVEFHLNPTRFLGCIMKKKLDGWYPSSMTHEKTKIFVCVPNKIHFLVLETLSSLAIYGKSTIRILGIYFGQGLTLNTYLWIVFTV